MPYPAAGAASFAWLGSVCCCNIVVPCGSWTLATTRLSAPPPSALPPPNTRNVAVNSCGCAAPVACIRRMHDLAPHGAEHQHAHSTATFTCAGSHNKTLDVAEPTCRNVSDVHCRLPGGNSILIAHVAHASARSKSGTIPEHGRIRWSSYPETEKLGGTSATSQLEAGCCTWRTVWHAAPAPTAQRILNVCAGQADNHCPCGLATRAQTKISVVSLQSNRLRCLLDVRSTCGS